MSENIGATYYIQIKSVIQNGVRVPLCYINQLLNELANFNGILG